MEYSLYVCTFNVNTYVMSDITQSFSKPLRITATVVRYLLGVIFFVFGLNGFINFLPPPEITGPAGVFMGGMAATGYLFPLVKGLEVVAGALLLSGFYVPLSIAILGPITLNIFLFHTLTPLNPVAIVVFVGNIFLVFAYKDYFKSIFSK